MESLARISNLIEHARDLTLEAAQSASAVGRRKDALNKATSAKETKKFLNSRMEREILEGLRRVTAVSLSTGVSEVWGWCG
jgi:AP-3 complex subunit beta